MDLLLFLSSVYPPVFLRIRITVDLRSPFITAPKIFSNCLATIQVIILIEDREVIKTILKNIRLWLFKSVSIQRTTRHLLETSWTISLKSQLPTTFIMGTPILDLFL